MFGNFQMNIVRNVNTLGSGIGFRGISTFSTEPGLFGGHMIGLFVILFCWLERYTFFPYPFWIKDSRLKLDTVVSISISSVKRSRLI